MAFEDIERHLVALGISPCTAGGFSCVDDALWREVAPGGAHVPDGLRWFFSRFGGSSFPGGVFYVDPRYGEDVMVGWFLDEAELRDAFESTRDDLPDDVVPIANDGGDNHLAAGVGPANSGVVYFRVHDAPLDRRLYIIDASFERFLRSLHREV